MTIESASHDKVAIFIQRRSVVPEQQKRNWQIYFFPSHTDFFAACECCCCSRRSNYYKWEWIVGLSFTTLNSGDYQRRIFSGLVLFPSHQSHVRFSRSGMQMILGKVTRYINAQVAPWNGKWINGFERSTPLGLFYSISDPVPGSISPLLTSSRSISRRAHEQRFVRRSRDGRSSSWLESLPVLLRRGASCTSSSKIRFCCCCCCCRWWWWWKNTERDDATTAHWISLRLIKLRVFFWPPA